MDKKSILQKYMLSYSGKGECNPQEKTITPSIVAQVITPDEGYTCLSKVNVEAVTSAIDSNITAENIKKDINILGVTGTLESGGSGEDLQSVIDGIIGGSSGTAFDVTSSATSIPKYKFEKCKIVNGNFPNATKIGYFAFYGCSSLTSIKIPNVTSLDNNAFDSCSSLKGLSLPKVTSIGAHAFYNCYSLGLFDFRKATQVPTLSGTNAFYNTSSSKKIVVPDALYDEWRNATNWSSTDYNLRASIIKASDYEATL